MADEEERRVPRAFERTTDEAKQYAAAFQSLIERMKLRQWCIEQVRTMTFKSTEDLIGAAEQVFDFCCEDIAAWLARYEQDH